MSDQDFVLPASLLITDDVYPNVEIRIGNTVANTNALTVRELWANGNNGNPNEILTSDGTYTYWAPPTAVFGVNTYDRYTWVNNHTFTIDVYLGNSTVNSTINSTTYSGTSNNASYLQGNTVSDIRLYADNKAANAYSNAIAYSGNAAQAYSNAITYSGNAAQAYSNAIAYSGNAAAAYVNAAAYADSKAATAYSNAIAYSGNAAQAYANAIAYSGNAAQAYANAIAYSGSAAVAYANAIAYSGNASQAYANAILYSGNAAQAYANAIAYSGNAAQAYANAIAYSTAYSGNAAQAYANAIAYSGNAAQAYSNAVSYANSTFLKLTGGTLTGNLVLGNVGLSVNSSYGTAGQVLTTNGSSTYWSTITASGGTVSSVGSGNGLTGGPITSSGSLSVLANSGIIANSTGVFVNASYIATLSANNTTYVNGKTEGNLNVNSASTATTATNQSGGTVSATTGSFSGRVGASASQSVGTLLNATGSLGGIELTGGGGANAAFMTFHRPGAFAAYFGLDNDNNFAVGGWSYGAALGYMKVGSLGVGTAASGTSGEIRATNEVTAYYSDARLKQDIETITNASEKLKLVSGVFYKNNELAKSYGFTKEDRQVGVLAQDIQKALPEAVRSAPFDIAADGSSKSGENYLTVKYELLVPLLVEALKEALERIEKLENK